MSKIDISKIRLGQLDATSLVWISKFAYTLEQHNGEVLALRDEFILKQVVSAAKRTDSAELKEIYMNLKSAMRRHINSEKFSHAWAHRTANDQSRFAGSNSINSVIV